MPVGVRVPPSALCVERRARCVERPVDLCALRSTHRASAPLLSDERGRGQVLRQRCLAEDVTQRDVRFGEILAEQFAAPQDMLIDLTKGAAGERELEGVGAVTVEGWKVEEAEVV